MFGQSSRSHIYRLGLILVVFLVGAAFARQWATPDSWNYEGWFREDSLTLALEQPLVYGGNESCVACHADVNREVRRRPHRGLACESCHGALADHVQDEEKFAAAIVDRSRWQCENCHAEQINRPAAFKQFSKTGAIGAEVGKHKTLDAATPCLKCHEAHDPSP
jgi:hypothetical protein